MNDVRQTGVRATRGCRIASIIGTVLSRNIISMRVTQQSAGHTGTIIVLRNIRLVIEKSAATITLIVTESFLGDLIGVGQSRGCSSDASVNGKSAQRIGRASCR